MDLNITILLSVEVKATAINCPEHTNQNYLKFYFENSVNSFQLTSLKAKNEL
jgi:hypothetical protein